MAKDQDVVIRLRDVYEIARRTEGKVDLIALSAAESRTVTNDHEIRLRTMEKRIWAIPSFAALMSIAAIVVSILRPGLHP